MQSSARNDDPGARDLAAREPRQALPAASTSLPADAWYALALLTAAYALNIADRYVISTLIEPIRLEMGLSDAGIGFVTGVALAVVYVTAGIPLAALADRWNRKKLLAVAVAVWSFMTAMCGAVQTYWQLVAARIGVGLGEAGGTPTSSTLLSDFFPARRRSMAFCVFGLGAPLGAWLGSDLAGHLAEQHGWRSAFVALGLPGLLLAVLIALTLREPVRGGLDPGHDPATVRFVDVLGHVRRWPAIMHLLAAATVLTFWSWGLMWWTPAYLMRSHGLSVAEAGALLGKMHLIGGCGGLLAAAWFTRDSASTSARRVTRVLAAGTVVATLPSVVAYATRSLELATAMLWLFVVATYFYIGPVMALLQNLSPPAMRAQVIAILLFVANVANLIVAPQLLGLASDVLAAVTDAGRHALAWALALAAPTGLWAAWHLWRCSSTIDQEQAVIDGIRGATVVPSRS